MNVTKINDKTGFAEGEKFSSKKEVVEYFTVSNMMSMFGESESQEVLDQYAEYVIDNNEHCNFTICNFCETEIESNPNTKTKENFHFCNYECMSAYYGDDIPEDEDFICTI